jgi:hypothetical protein
MKKLKYVKLFENFQDEKTTFLLVDNVSDDYFNFIEVKFIKMLDQSLEPEYKQLGGNDFEGLMIPATMEVEIIEARYFCGYDGKSLNLSIESKPELVIGNKLHLRCNHDGPWEPGKQVKLKLKLKFNYDQEGNKTNRLEEVQVETKEDLKKIFDILETEVQFFAEESKDYNMFANSINSLVLRK